MAEEIRRLFPVLLLPGPPPVIEVAAASDVGWRAWGQLEDIYVLVVNSAVTANEAVLTMPGTPRAVACELGEGAGRLDGRRVTLELGPLEPRLLRVTLAP